jgi:hypothetical protein
MEGIESFRVFLTAAEVAWRLAARASGLAFGLALAVRPRRVGSGSARKAGSGTRIQYGFTVRRAGQSGHRIGAAARIEVIQMPWWEIVLFLMAVAVAIWGFLALVGLDTRVLTRRTERRAEDLYRDYASLTRKQRRYAREHGGQRHDHEE